MASLSGGARRESPRRSPRPFTTIWGPVAAAPGSAAGYRPFTISDSESAEKAAWVPDKFEDEVCWDTSENEHQLASPRAVSW
jgi:hypothetical protein